MGSAAKKTRGQQVHIQGVNRYKYKGQQVQIQEVSRYKYKRSAGTNT